MTSPKVLFIGGFRRSGSTLLDRLLGQVPGITSAGEIRHIWQHGFIENRLCGCERPFASCSFWNAVFETAFGGMDAIDLEGILALKGRVDHFYRTPQIALGKPSSFGDDVRRYVGILERLYAGIAEISATDVIVDSTKDASHGWLLSRTSGIDLRVLQLVRDSRATAHSCRRKKFNPGSGKDMQGYGLLRASLGWNASHVLINALRRTDRPFMVLTYEELVNDPRTSLGLVLDLVGHAGEQVPVDLGGMVVLTRDHTVAGNPIRFQTGEITIRSDDEWRSTMPSSGRALVSALTWPVSRYATGRRAEEVEP